MKKIIVVVLAILMIVTALAGCSATTSNSAATAAPTQPATQAPAQTPAATANSSVKKTFTVGFDQNFPPYGYVGTDGKFTGFDLDLAAEVAKRNGWELKLQPIEWDAKDMELSSKAIDCIWNGFTINGRESAYTWTDPYMNNTQVFIVKASSGIKTFADLKGKTVTVQTDSSAQTAIESDEYKDLKASFKKLMTCADYNTAFMDLDSGAVDAIAMDVGVARFQVKGRENQFVILEQPLSAEQYGVGFLLGNTALRDQVETTLKAMVADGMFAKISNNYFSCDVGILGK